MPTGEPGLVVLFGSGETAPSSGKTHEFVARRLNARPEIAILETPAGFEPNSPQVAGKIESYLSKRLQNFEPQIDILPARKKGTAHSPDDPDIVRPLLRANWIFLGPGSPTYAAKQLRNSLALDMIAARHRLGATLMLASSATLAFSAFTMPVYEIYKVGQDLHWQEGANFFAPFGLPLVVIPHWNNTDGGAELDTSRCYLGRERFGRLLEMLPEGQTIVGLDEHTSLVIDKAAAQCQVLGHGRVVILRNGDRNEFSSGDTFHPEALGQWRLPDDGAGIRPAVWQEANEMHTRQQAEQARSATPSAAVEALVTERSEARAAGDWNEADALRDQIAELGWQVNDTPHGPQLEPLET